MSDGRQTLRIGFVDYQLHNFHAHTFLDAIRGPLADRGFQVAGAWALQEEPSKAWAARREVAYFDDLNALDRCVDAYMILAPSNPETHWELGQRVFPTGKPTYVDKTFAPSYAEAERLFELADRCGAPVQTSSALRYAHIVSEARQLPAPLRHLSVWGGGTSFDEYAIHPVELAIAIMGADALAISSFSSGAHRTMHVRFSDERSASIHVNCGAHVPYLAAATTDADTTILRVDLSRLFVDATAAILDFLASGAPHVERAETFLIRKILDLGAQSTAAGNWTRLDSPAAAAVPRPKSSDRILIGRGDAKIAPPKSATE